MGLAIKNNIMASNAARHLGKSFGALAQSVERLSSGLRINSAKDDAAGLAVRELMRADIAVLQQGSRNASDGISMLQTMEGAMAVMDENLIRMKELAEQAATGSYSAEQRIIMDAEFAEMAEEIERISNSTAFNGITMLNTGTGDVDIHVGTTEVISINNVDMTKAGLGIETGSAGYAFEDTTDATTALTDAAYMTFNDTVGTDDCILTIQFTGGAADEDVITVAYSDASSYTIAEFVDTINSVTQNLGNDADGNSKNYEMASAVRDVDGYYHLKLDSRLSDTTGATITVTSGGTQESAGLGGYTTEGDWTADTTGAAGSGLNILDEASAVTALAEVGSAIQTKDTARAMFGYKMNRLESTQSVLNIQAENLMTAESRISDVDVASEMAVMTRNQVLSQAGVAMLSQANTMPQMALSLLR